jgi:hypothetical protein
MVAMAKPLHYCERNTDDSWKPRMQNASELQIAKKYIS